MPSSIDHYALVFCAVGMMVVCVLFIAYPETFWEWMVVPRLKDSQEFNDESKQIFRYIGIVGLFISFVILLVFARVK